MGVLLATVAATTLIGVAPVDVTDLALPKTDEVHGELQHYCPPTCSVDESIRAAANTYGVSYARLDCLARLESTRNPGAVNRQSGAQGLFQFMPNRQGGTLMDSTPYAGQSPFNAWAAAHATAYLLARGYGSHWTAWRYC